MPRLNVTRTFSLPNLLICGLSIFYAGSALSESKAERLPEFEDVYRIELIIFTNRNNLDAFNDNDDNNTLFLRAQFTSFNWFKEAFCTLLKSESK